MVHEATDVGRRVEKYRGLGNMRNAVVVIGGATREGGREATPRDRRGPLPVAVGGPPTPDTRVYDDHDHMIYSGETQNRRDRFFRTPARTAYSLSPPQLKACPRLTHGIKPASQHGVDCRDY